MLGPTVLCSSAQAFSRAMEERAEGKKRLRSSLGPSVLKIIAIIVIFSGFPSLPCVGAKEDAPVSLACSASGSETTCTCSTQVNTDGESNRSAILSKETNILSVNCDETLQFFPTGENGTTVCPAGVTAQNQCNLSVPELLSEKSDVKWEDCDIKAKGKNPCKRLTIPEVTLPFVDQKFAVGCTANPADSSKICEVPVTIQARATETNGQTVTCAYGADSNEIRQAVTLNPSKNSFTLVCGDKGTVLPTNYDTKFCSSDPEKAKETCDGDYESILPGFENSWWKKNIFANSFTLSIPVEKFPTEQAKMVVACQQTTPKPSSKIAKDEIATSSVCRVDVSIEAGGAASLSLGSWYFSSWLLAFAVTLLVARFM
ncbi:SAG-related sequence [Besnoitia besnoiti]|uniref:SAG-related sequence n=1 Tax=Besnoitia besnoiti TaxID=94643 RepID=A0A2A9MJE9_BESBE|nr:SAG-related sequence [Besnoitia besnoiti]PFH36096.1 SAG-related sequence [Besnoitia besnoiti]